MLELIGVLDSKSRNNVNWFKENKMVVHPDTLQAMIIDKIETKQMRKF